MTLDSPSDLCDTMYFIDEEAEAKRSEVLPLAPASQQKSLMIDLPAQIQV